jgi:hypothetical protein
MTEAKGDTCTEPEQMVRSLYRCASDRKVRLLICACWRYA